MFNDVKSTCRETLIRKQILKSHSVLLQAFAFFKTSKPKAGKALLQNNIDKLFTINALKLGKQNMTNTPLLMAESGQPFDDIFTPET